VAELLAKAEAVDQAIFLTDVDPRRNWRIERPAGEMLGPCQNRALQERLSGAVEYQAKLAARKQRPRHGPEAS